MSRQNDFQLVKETLFRLDELLTAKNKIKFYAYLDQFEDANGKYVIDTIEDLSLKEWPNKQQRIASRAEVVEIFNARLDGFIKIIGINPGREWLDSFNEKKEWQTN